MADPAEEPTVANEDAAEPSVEDSTAVVETDKSPAEADGAPPEVCDFVSSFS